MSCGNHHEMPCQEVLAVMVLFVDKEELPCESALVVTHLQECPPCQSQFSAETVMKSLIARALCPQQAPSEVHSQVLASITQIHVEITTVREHP